MLKIAGLAMASALLGTVLKSWRAEVAQAFNLAAGIMVLYLAASAAGPMVNLGLKLMETLGSGKTAAGAAVTVAAIGIVGEVAAQTCADAGQQGLAYYVRLGCRILALTATAPVFLEVLTWIGSQG